MMMMGWNAIRMRWETDHVSVGSQLVVEGPLVGQLTARAVHMA